MPLDDLFPLRQERDSHLAAAASARADADAWSAQLAGLRPQLAAAQGALATLRADPNYPRLSELPQKRSRRDYLQARKAELDAEMERARAAGDFAWQTRVRLQIQEVMNELTPLLADIAVLEDLQARVTAAQNQVSSLQAQVSQAQAALGDAQRWALDHAAAADTRSTSYSVQAHDLLDPYVRTLQATVPLALLPVRIETRFLPRDGGGTDLWVRVYPDDMHGDTHEPGLTDEERTAGERFLQQSQAPEAGAHLGAWTALADRFGAPRAAWIARAVSSGSPARRDAEWTRAPRTDVLPDRWMALGYREGRLSFAALGSPIPDTLPVGPAPGTGAAADGGPAADEGMRWMLELPAALAAGMALRIPLTPQEAQGIERLVGTGVKGALDPAASAGRLERLLEAHRHTWGAGLVPPGTPTNNTGAERAGDDDARDPAASFRAERGEPLFEPGDGSDGDRLARALGIAPGALAHVAGAGATHGADAGDVNNALWAVTWRYYVRQMILGQLPAYDLPAWREFFRRHVRAGGPLATLRVGSQPYGILPVTVLEDGPWENAWMTGLLRRLREAWRRALPHAPRLGRTGDPDRDLLEVLRMEPVSGAFDGRNVAGRRYAYNLAGFMGQAGPVTEYVQQRAQAEMAEFTSLGPSVGGGRIPSSTRGGAFPIPLPLSLGDPEKPRLEWLAEAGPTQLRSETGPELPDSLLYLLLRHSLLLEYGQAAFHFQGGDVPAWQAYEAELVGMPDDPESYPTVWEWLARVAPGYGGGRPLTEALALEDDPGRPETRELLSARGSLDRLKDRDPRLLGTHLAGTLDLASHRLDAWITAVASHRLEKIRSDLVPTGVHLGAYAWVEDLRA
ncbi:MAG TPA: hypothetical protein VFQ76_00055, partial [Longimicrobiaceae bacterium]|nr:hypothetical protein [Longimicrobiaceae bacterium]